MSSAAERLDALLAVEFKERERLPDLYVIDEQIHILMVDLAMEKGEAESPAFRAHMQQLWQQYKDVCDMSLTVTAQLRGFMRLAGYKSAMGDGQISEGFLDGFKRAIDGLTPRDNIGRCHVAQLRDKHRRMTNLLRVAQLASR